MNQRALSAAVDAPPLRLVGADGPASADDHADALIAAFMAAADADNTVRTYASAWRGFAAWCAEHGHTALPAAPRIAARYLAVCAADTERALKKDTFTVWAAAIGRMHSGAGLPDPTADATVRRTMRGIRRTQAGENPDQAPPITLEVLQDIVTHIHDHAGTWRQKVAARRDIALLVLMYAAALRRSEAVGLDIGHLRVVDGPAGTGRLRIRLHGSKASQTSAEDLYLKPGTTDALWCPWCALIRWQVVLTAADQAAHTTRIRLRDEHGHTDDDPETSPAADQIIDAVSIAVQRVIRTDDSDPHQHRCHDWPAPFRARARLFRPLSHGGIPHDADTALTGRSVDRLVAARADAVGASGRGHSLHAGVATWMRDNGATRPACKRCIRMNFIVSEGDRGCRSKPARGKRTRM
ncbi:hypothetical protein [Nocardia tengchongensis]|uniref:hypothetical protein n=1 Tax=Nocardia tengchongensis TaxID=2055889 RepID=UPI0036140058